jgi:hypothetical protein
LESQRKWVVGGKGLYLVHIDFEGTGVGGLKGENPFREVYNGACEPGTITGCDNIGMEKTAKK